jgi:prepilin-type N-terminal cleavage/methylation domain-containing protein
VTPVHPHQSRGFTLLELMVVALIMGTILLLVPANMDNLGARSKLESTANSLVAAFNGARERAILDGYEVAVELGTFRDEDGDWKYGWRFRFTNLVAASIKNPDDPEAQDDDPESRRDQEREWLFTPWHECQEGVVIAGVSEKKDIWKKLNEGGRSSEVRFFADGDVENGIAVRFESEDLEVERRYKTVTVMVNPLTSEPSWEDGEQDLNESRPASDFGT